MIPAVGRGGRNPLHRDALEARIVAGDWTPPRAGERLVLPEGGSRTWEAARAGEDGWLEHSALRGGYACWAVALPAGGVRILEASGHAMVYVNGEPRAGDPYSTGIVRLPVLLRRGENHLLFQGGRGRLRARLAAPPAPLFLDTADATLPDLLVGEAGQRWGAVVVVNATEAPRRGLRLRATVPGGRSVVTDLPTVPPLSVRNVGFRIAAPARPGDSAPVSLELIGGDGPLRNASAGRAASAPRSTVTLRVRRADQTHKRTFRSAIDGSIQYYAVNPAERGAGRQGRPALFLSLHGAGVEAIGQADAYSPKSWGHLVAPTNRRPYGFDWEDWGRLDALEVLAEAERALGTDPARTYLTGHSMGGHGAWHLGVTYPDRFAAVAPSAGWISFWSYGGSARPEQPSPLEALLERARAPSDTRALARNSAAHGVYLLHGGADDNVPPNQARTMVEQLATFHRDWVYHEQPGAGHWWDASDEPGADCVDWAPMFDFFARRSRPQNASVRQLEFTTASPGVSARCYWASIEAQERILEPSTVRLRWDPGRRRFAGSTQNVARLALDLGHAAPAGPLAVELDGQRLEGIAWPDTGRRVWLSRTGGAWVVGKQPAAALKGPHRYGPFKEGFRHRFLFVYGTRGSATENAWAFAKARFDAETFWYRGNGSVEMVADSGFDPGAERDRSVILYGNAETNGAWAALLGRSPVQVRRGSVTVSDRTIRGEDLACFFLRPRPGSDHATIAAVSGSGLVGMRLTDRLPYFVSGVAYPDCTILAAETLATGPHGLRAAGFFGLDWSVERGEWAWQP